MQSLHEQVFFYILRKVARYWRDQMVGDVFRQVSFVFSNGTKLTVEETSIKYCVK